MNVVDPSSPAENPFLAQQQRQQDPTALASSSVMRNNNNNNNSSAGIFVQHSPSSRKMFLSAGRLVMPRFTAFSGGKSPAPLEQPNDDNAQQMMMMNPQSPLVDSDGVTPVAAAHTMTVQIVTCSQCGVSHEWLQESLFRCHCDGQQHGHFAAPATAAALPNSNQPMLLQQQQQQPQQYRPLPASTQEPTTTPNKMTPLPITHHGQPQQPQVAQPHNNVVELVQEPVDQRQPPSPRGSWDYNNDPYHSNGNGNSQIMETPKTVRHRLSKLMLGGGRTPSNVEEEETQATQPSAADPPAWEYADHPEDPALQEADVLTNAQQQQQQQQEQELVLGETGDETTTPNNNSGGRRRLSSFLRRRSSHEDAEHPQQQHSVAEDPEHDEHGAAEQPPPVWDYGDPNNKDAHAMDDNVPNSSKDVNASPLKAMMEEEELPTKGGDTMDGTAATATTGSSPMRLLSSLIPMRRRSSTNEKEIPRDHHHHPDGNNNNNIEDHTYDFATRSGDDEEHRPVWEYGENPEPPQQQQPKQLEEEQQHHHEDHHVGGAAEEKGGKHRRKRSLMSRLRGSRASSSEDAYVYNPNDLDHEPQAAEVGVGY